MITSEGDRIVLTDIQDEMKCGDGRRTEGLSLPEAVERLEESYVRSAYAATGSSMGAAKLLGISQSTAFRKIQK
jgi:transcriptional regulator with PAS, ATPase and Fis domain